MTAVLASDAIVVMGLLLVVSLTVDFAKYWFVFGISALYLAVRHGFEVAILTNAGIFLLIYFLPIVMGKELSGNQLLNEQLTELHLGMCLLYVSTSVVGRVISDLRHAEKKMQSKNRILELTNEELQHTNRELDRFVYSVSHDLTAPLKSIQGLVNISKFEDDSTKLKSYFDLVGNRVTKLENFIAEVLDFSRSNRKELKIERVSIPDLLNEVLSNHQDTEIFHKLRVEMKVEVNEIQTDRLLLRIILNNLITNSLNYQKPEPHHQPVIQLSVRDHEDHLAITVTDNGQGIPREIHHRLFTMFFRGNTKSAGSGLGLYIAKEAASRIQGKISFRSDLGVGSDFTLKLPK